jgi:hypothetical protein
MLLFSQTLRLGRLYRHHVGTTDDSPSVVPVRGRYTDKGSLASFSQGAVLPTLCRYYRCPYCFNSEPPPLGSTDTVSVVPVRGRYTDKGSLASFSQGAVLPTLCRYYRCPYCFNSEPPPSVVRTPCR